MAPDDRGLVLRGFFVLALIGIVVTVVMTILFMRPPSVPPKVEVGDMQPSEPGADIRYNAVLTLARKGSAAVPWSTVSEMLDEKQQMRNALVRLPDGTQVIDEAAARAKMIGALRALTAWHEKQSGKLEPSPELREVYARVDKLSESPIVELKAQADKARSTFFR